MGDIGTVKSILEQSLTVKEEFLADDVNIAAVAEAASIIEDCYRRGGKVIVFGNGGSAADSQHLAAELLVRFEKERKSLPCIALSTNTSVLTAAANDYDFDQIFKIQVDGLGAPQDVVIAISTSGNSGNVIEGAKAARKKGMPVIALTGRDGGKLVEEADASVIVRSENTARIQEVHVIVIHIICKIVEDALSE
ncbi:MAG: SIS domain-containing protein [Candidatus Omnitrophota bacterium]|nr:SIS domain-containing protein [Candidatus Omnitrophota bacterium]